MSPSRTMVSAVDAQQNTSFNSSVPLPAMKLEANADEMKSSNTIESKAVQIPVAERSPTPISTENVTIQTKMTTENLTVAKTDQLQQSTLVPNQNTKSLNNNILTNSSTSCVTPRTIKKSIALVGGDIILEEEEDLEEESQQNGMKLETPTLGEVQTEHAVPTLTAPQSPLTASHCPTPIYVNASVLHQKKNLSYGQNIKTTQDNKNLAKVLTKPKL